MDHNSPETEIQDLAPPHDQYEGEGHAPSWVVYGCHQLPDMVIIASNFSVFP